MEDISTKERMLPKERFVRLMQLSKDVSDLDPEHQTYVLGLVDGLMAKKEIEVMIRGIA